MNSRGPDHQHEGALQKLEWLLSRIIGGNHSETKAPNTSAHHLGGTHQSFLEEIAEDVEREIFSTIERAVIQVEGLLQEAIHQPNKLLQIAITFGLDLVEDIIDPAIDILKKVGDHTFEHAGSLSTLIKNAALEEIDLPFIKDLFSLIDGGKKLTILNIYTLLSAIPATIIYKVIEGDAPFKGIDNISLASVTEKKVWAVFYGVFQIIDGILSAFLDVYLNFSGIVMNSSTGRPLLMSDPDDTPTHTELIPTRLMVILNLISTLNNIMKQISGFPGGYPGAAGTDAFPDERPYNKVSIVIWAYQWFANLLDIISLAIDSKHYRVKYNSLGSVSLGWTIGYEVLHLIFFSVYDGLQRGEEGAEPAEKQIANIVDPFKGGISSALMLTGSESPWVKGGIVVSDVALQILYAGLQWGYASKIQ